MGAGAPPVSTPIGPTRSPTWPSRPGTSPQLATVVSGYAPGPGRDGARFLEGGYDLEALRTSVSATLGALVGSNQPTEAPTSGGPGVEHLRTITEQRRQQLE